jgi:hypothetical protein
MIEFVFNKEELKEMINQAPASSVNISVKVEFKHGAGRKEFIATVLAAPVLANGETDPEGGNTILGCPVPPNCK